MKRIPHRELRNNSSTVLRQVQAGESFAVTNHGDVVAVLVPPDQGIEMKLLESRVRGGFKDLHLEERPERTEDVLTELREE
ncbi:MAG: type II toxin-antitoxin system prevent-host-death family antitoxin [Actinobacteria bacterium]|nr:type II toxin-antitoxin system prevent-host-death family antitoxin [Actinomycetota bacterium]